MRDWLLASGGYLYTHLEGDGSFSQMFSSVSSTITPYAGDFGNRITLSQQSHALSANALLGPWEGLTLSGGVQSEWTHNDGSVDLLATNIVTRVGESVSGTGEPGSARDRTALDEELVQQRIVVVPNSAPIPHFKIKAGNALEQVVAPPLLKLLR